METVAIALGLAIVLVLILLMSCWCPKPHNSSEDGSKETMDNPEQVSDTGSGLMNRKLQSQYNDLKNLQSYDDYDEVVQYGSLDPEVISSHNEYTQEMNRGTSGASMGAIRSDANDVVPFVGVRRTDYQGAYAKKDARVDHSEFPDQMPRRTPYML